MQVNLRVLAGPYQGRVFAFNQHDTFLIGRTDDAHLCLPDDRFFSRHHGSCPTVAIRRRHAHGADARVVGSRVQNRER